MMNNTKKCIDCKIEKNISEFYSRYIFCRKCARKRIQNSDKKKRESHSFKTCTKCVEEKPIAEYFIGNARCKTCINKYRRERRKKLAKPKIPRTSKVCNICKIDKVISEYYNNFGCCKLCRNNRLKDKRKLLKEKPPDFEFRICTDCKINKSSDEYFRGYTFCKPCLYQRAKEKRKKVSQMKKEQYVPVNHAKCGKCHKVLHFDNYFCYGKKRRSRCKNCVNIQQREYIKKRLSNKQKKCSKYTKNGSLCLECKKEWDKQLYVKQKNSAIQNTRYREDLNYQLIYRLRSNFKRRLNCKLRGKRTSTVCKLLTCSYEELQKYLELLFQEGMTWENYGKWHIDHILPISFFNLTKKINQQICWHHTNLQPLWRSDNISKGSKIPKTLPKNHIILSRVYCGSNLNDLAEYDSLH